MRGGNTQHPAFVQLLYEDNRRPIAFVQLLYGGIVPYYAFNKKRREGAAYCNIVLAYLYEGNAPPNSIIQWLYAVILG